MLRSRTNVEGGVKWSMSEKIKTTIRVMLEIETDQSFLDVTKILEAVIEAMPNTFRPIRILSVSSEQGIILSF